jgi:hypothetical protein
MIDPVELRRRALIVLDEAARGDHFVFGRHTLISLAQGTLDLLAEREAAAPAVATMSPPDCPTSLGDVWIGETLPDPGFWGRTAARLLAELAAAHVARDAAQETIRYMRDDWHPFSAQGCRLCVYENGVFMRMCKIHEHLDWLAREGL